MAVKPAYWDQATGELARRDRVLKKLVARYPDIHLQRRSDPFTTLARAIVGQQISVKAAETIWQRFVATVAPAHRGRAFPRLVRPQSPRRRSTRCAPAGCRSARPSTCPISPATSSRVASIRGDGRRWTTRR